MSREKCPLVRLTCQGAVAWIKPSQVGAVEACQCERSRVWLSNGQGFEVDGAPDDVVAALWPPAPANNRRGTANGGRRGRRANGSNMTDEDLADYR